MMRWLVIGQFFILLFSTAAGEITGTIAYEGDIGETPPPVVIYLEAKDQAKPPPPEKKPLLSQKNAQFSPRLLIVVTGQTVSMPNDDAIAHNVFSYSKVKQFNLGIYPKGDTREVTFEKPGRVDIYCSIHRHMHAIILVVPTPYFDTSSPGKEFQIKDVPDGEYVLRTWMDGAKEWKEDVVVSEGAAQRVEMTIQPADADTPES